MTVSAVDDDSEGVQDDGEDDDMMAALQDAAGGMYFNVTGDGFPEEQNTSKEDFSDLFQQAEKELYPGCTKFSALTFIVKLTNIKELNRWSDKSFDMLLQLLREAFPKGTKIGKSLYKNKDLDKCPICAEPCYKFQNAKGKRIPHESRHNAADMRWHKEKHPNKEGVLKHPADGEAWKHFYEKFPTFSAEPETFAPGKDIDIYLRPLIDELIDLWDRGVMTYNVSTNENLRMHSVINRRNLPIRHAWRNNTQVDGKSERTPAPRNFIEVEMLQQLDRVREEKPRKHPDNVDRKRKHDSCELNWTKKSIFFELAYWFELKIRHILDVMHIEKNICENVVGTMLGIEGKSKDTVKVWMDLEDLGIRKHLRLQRHGNRVLKPIRCYSLTLDEKREFCIRPYVNKEVSTTITELAMFFQKICARKLTISDLDAMQDGIVITLCKLEKKFPPAFFDIMFHLAVQLPYEAKMDGPVHTRWMYPFESGHTEVLQNRGVINIDEICEKEFPGWFKEKDPNVSKELYTLACGPNYKIKSYRACDVNGVRYRTKSRDAGRVTQNSSIWVEVECCDYYGLIEEILELNYTFDHKVELFKCTWYDPNVSRKNIHTDIGITSINISAHWYENEPYVLSRQACQVFYVDDYKLGQNWKVVQKFHHRHVLDVPDNLDERDGNDNNVEHGESEAYQEISSKDVEITFELTYIEQLN
ncbi:uncharacterized protein LOC111408629 [Olea europaea var. sylvestris]|uniref:uncharacterized protein LOC111408629 n=1 Tax=Olea europaea var. sylvestris TaxID=158386 RepID=UPI000C1CCF75|nr:uncharacterized protein LOC111408629 [Olea europaea var. sylvestris]